MQLGNYSLLFFLLAILNIFLDGFYLILYFFKEYFTKIYFETKIFNSLKLSLLTITFYH